LLIGVTNADLYGATFVGNDQQALASLVKFEDASWSRVLTFGELPFPALSGMLAADASGSKFWLAAGESGHAGQDTLYYAPVGSNNATTLTTASPMTTLNYAHAADEFLGTWQRPGQDEHLFFGALDPYHARQNMMDDLTANASIPWATFGGSALDQGTLAFHFVVGIESSGGQSFSLARVAPNGHGIDVLLGKGCLVGCTLQSVEHLEGITNPLVLMMTPGELNRTQGALYTYSWVQWDVGTGAPMPGTKVVGSWQHPRYNTFSATAAGGGSLWAADAFSVGNHSIVQVDAVSGTVTTLPLSGLEGTLFDLEYAT
jgi:hypothetical protein